MGVPRGELLSTRATTFTNLDDAGVVIEAGYTKSWDSLRQKARWWFAASHFDVKIVILAKFDPSSRGGRITIEKWKAVEAVLRPGVRTWAQANVPAQATCIQSIHITCRALGNDLEDPASYDMFTFDNQPANLKDSVIDIEELQAYAADFWLTNQ
ncbi:hypothetical protein F5887DRAFT_919099 [Amanita rubescens]|nr:hypothetical protein F5887DRAFT_919099 [Amanita rubescens]